MSILGGNQRIAAIQRALDDMSSPQQVKQFMAMHRNDAIAVSMADQKLQQMMRPQATPPQPTVVDQKLAQPTPAPMQGVAALNPGTAVPEEGYAGGGVVAFARGGDAGEGKAPKLAYRQYALTRAAQMGLDPKFVDTIFGIESQYNPNAKSPTGPVGIGQLTKATGKAYGVSEDERTDPYKNIDASLRFMADLQKKYNGDHKKMALAYNQGEPVADAHIRENKGQVNPEGLRGEAKNYLAKLATRMAPGATAQAAPAPAPAANKEKDGLAGLYSQYAPRRSLQTQSHGQMVPPPVTGAPIDARAPAGPVPDRNTQLNTIAAQETARRSGLASVLPPEQRAEFERNPAPVELGEGQKPEPVAEPADVGVMDYPDTEYQSGPHPRAGFKPAATEEPPTQRPEDVPVEDRVGTPVAQKGRFTDDDWLMAGLATLANEDPSALKMIGTGGLEGLKNKRSRESDEAKRAVEQAQMDLYRSQGKWYSDRSDIAQAQADARNRQVDLRAQQLASQEAQALLKQDMATAGSKLQGLDPNNPLVMQKYNEYLAAAYRRLGIEMPAGATMQPASAMVPGDISGIKVLGVRPN